MQQQFQAELDFFKRPFLGYSPRGSVMRKEREISPWGGAEQPRKTFNPAQYYQTITNQLKETNKQQRNRSTPLAHPQKGPFKMAKNSSIHEDSPFRMSLVTVDLDEQAVNSDRRMGRTIEFFRKGEGKQQPVRVRIFKKIQQKNQQAEEEYAERMVEFIKEFQGEEQNNPFSSIDSGNVYQSMPKRNTRISYQRTRGYLQTSRNGFFPRISIEKQKSSKQQPEKFLCKGELITGKKQAQSMRRINFRSTQLSEKGQKMGEGVIFLKKHSCQC